MAKNEASPEQLRAQWMEAAPRWIERMRGRGDPSRAGLLDAWMLETIGDVRGQDVIDLGCGEGRFCRMLRECGANVTGVDLCSTLLDEAKKLDPVGQYLLGEMECLSEVPAAGFELAVSYVTLVDVADHVAAINEAFRVLRPGGRFVICNLAPMVTAGNMWLKYGDGTKVCFRLDNYLDEGGREMVMCATRMTNIHRTLSSYLNSFLAAGFVIEGIREPYPSAEQVARYPENEDMLRVPLFIIYMLRKPNR